MSKKQSAIEIRTVIVDRVKSTSEKFSVFTARPADAPGDYYPVKMFVGPVSERQRWVVCGQEKDDPRWGKQFACEFATLAAPTTPYELDVMIRSGHVEGWGYDQVYELVRHPERAQLIDIIERHPEELIGYESITAEMMATLQTAWQRGSKLAGVYARLGELGITGTLTDRIVKQYGFDTIERLEEDPYKPIFDVERYGWKTAESVARQLEIESHDPRRLKAGLAVAVAEETWKAGHTWLTERRGVALASGLLEIDQDEVRSQVAAACEDGRLVSEADRLYPRGLYEAETEIAASIAQRMDRQQAGPPSLAPHDRSRSQLSDMQFDAVEMALASHISLLTGGPGCGKTTTIKELVACAQEHGMSVTLMAPTGKAAMRMREATGYEARTIHSTLGIKPGEWTLRNEPLSGLVVVDECSMLDTQLAAAVMRGVSPAANLVLVGDPDQLPSVGPGAVLRDLISIDAIPRVHLTRVFRNEAGVAVNAARIRAGEMIVSLPDCAVIKTEDSEQTAERILRYIARERPENCLVLVGTHEGPIGRWELNRRLQALLNPEEEGRGIRHRIGEHEQEIRLGDRVMLTRNNADLDYFNGDTGVVRDVIVPRSITVDLDGADSRTVTLAGENKHDATLAYAITGHKAQGSEAAIVIVAVAPSRVNSREWLYTAMTRGKQQVFLVGSTRAMEDAIGNRIINERRTTLVERVREALEG